MSESPPPAETLARSDARIARERPDRAENSDAGTNSVETGHVENGGRR
ncbi:MULTISPECIES: hypothetical protein [unclassified Streptomyces]